MPESGRLTIDIDRETWERWQSEPRQFIEVPMVPHRFEVGPGELRTCSSYDCPDCVRGKVPDPQWVEAGKPCEWCDGDGIGERCYVGAEASCDECEGSGKPRIPIRVPCPHAEGDPECDCQCPTCVGGECNLWDGWVRVGWATIRDGPLPIVSRPSDQPDTPCIAPLGGTLAMLWHRDTSIHVSGASVIEVGPNPESLVGKWGAVIEVQP